MCPTQDIFYYCQDEVNKFFVYVDMNKKKNQIIE